MPSFECLPRLLYVSTTTSFQPDVTGSGVLTPFVANFGLVEPQEVWQGIWPERLSEQEVTDLSVYLARLVYSGRAVVLVGAIPGVAWDVARRVVALQLMCVEEEAEAIVRAAYEMRA